MSDQQEPVPTKEEPAFGNSFEDALAAAFADAGVKNEPSNPKPDEIVIKGAEDADDVVVDDIEDVVDKEKPDILLPIDEEVEDQDEPDVTGMTKSAGERFKTLRAETKEIKKALATKEQEFVQAQARVKELEAVNGTSEELQKKIEEYELELSISRLESLPAYKAAVTAPLADIAKTAADIAKKHDINVDKLLDAIAIDDADEQDSAFDELLSGVNDRDRLKIFGLAEKLPAIMAEKTKLESNREGAKAELEARATAEGEVKSVESAKARKAAVDLVSDRVVKALPFLKESGKFSLEAVKAKLEEADFDALDTTTKAYNAYSGHLVPQLAKAYSTVLKELESLTDELSKYKKSTPAVKGSGGSSTPTIGAEVSFADAVEAAFAGSR